jgi:YebC/PmpR family DNA-binding regulatory protein
MSGHSKWSTIRHKKAAQDSKRANVFTKLGNMITVAAHEGGGDMNTNFKLKMATDKARSENMPKDNIERAIKRGTGELKEGSQIEEIIYEAYGPGQTAMLIKTATDNKNRTVGEIRHLLTKNNGKFVPSGSVSYMFETIGNVVVSTKNIKDIEEFEMIAIEAGAEDIEKNEDNLIIKTRPVDTQRVKEVVEKEGFETERAELVFEADQKNKLEKENREKYLRLIEVLEENDDVIDIYDNLE